MSCSSFCCCSRDTVVSIYGSAQRMWQRQRYCLFLFNVFVFGVRNGDSRHPVQLCGRFGFSLQKVTQPAVSTESEQMIIVYRWSFKVKVCFDSFVLNASIKLLLLTEQTYIRTISLISALPTSAGVLICLLVNSSIILTLKSFWLQHVIRQEPARKVGGGMFCGLHLQ